MGKEAVTPSCAVPTTPLNRFIPGIALTRSPIGAPGEHDLPAYFSVCRVSRVISLGAKIRNGGPQKPVPRLV